MRYDLLDWSLLGVGVACYLAACVWSVRGSATRTTAGARGWRLLVALGWAACVAFLFHAAAQRHACPVAYRPEAMAFVTSLLVLICAALDFSLRMRGLTAVSVPIAMLLLAGAMVPVGGGATAPKGHWLYLHISLMLASYSALTIGFLGGILFLYQEAQLRRKRLGALSSRLPSLEAADRLNLRALLFGFPLLTLGILVGAVWAREQGVLDTAWWSDPKVILSLFTWILYLVVLALRLHVRFGGRRIAYLTVLGFGFLAFTLLGASLVGKGFHRW